LRLCSLAISKCASEGLFSRANSLRTIPHGSIAELGDDLDAVAEHDLAPRQDAEPSERGSWRMSLWERPKVAPGGFRS
jgi:hypothetical protein